MLDFGGAFTLFIPNMEGNFFQTCTTEVEVQVKPISNGTDLTYMKFVFQSPAMEIVAPVLEDKTLGYRVLTQNTACVFLGRIFPGPGDKHSQQQQITPVQNSQIPSHVIPNPQSPIIRQDNPQQQATIMIAPEVSQQHSLQQQLYYSPQPGVFNGHLVNTPAPTGSSLRSTPARLGLGELPW